MTKKYYITVGDSMKLLATYVADKLYKVDIEETIKMNEDQVTWIWNFVPRTITDLAKYHKHPKVKFRFVPADLSFQTFWDLYDYKLGKKARAEKLWNALNDTDRAKALAAIPAYEFFRNTNNTKKMYAEGWLAQRRFENEFKIK